MALPSVPPSMPEAFRWYDPRRAGVRFVASLAGGVVAALVFGRRLDTWSVALVGWDAGSIVMLAMTWAFIARSDASETRRRAAAEDPGHTAVWVVVVLSSAFSVFAAAWVLHQGQAPVVESRGAPALIGLGSVACSWLLTHTSYALRYAHLYYRDDDGGVGGLVFPGNEPPDEVDFVYFAFTLGMTFQVSDVVITNRSLRRTALVHAVISFAYNTAILALALNATFGQFQPK